MKKFRKVLNLKIVSLIISISFLFTPSSYPYSSKDSLRVPVGQKELYERIKEANNNGRYPNLSIEEFMSLTKEERILAFLPLVGIIASGKMPDKPIPSDDPEVIEELKLAGNEALVRTISEDTFDPKLGNRPSTYFTDIIYNAMLMEMRQLTRYETGSIKSTLDKHAGTGLVNNRNNFHYEDLESLDRNMLSAVYDDHESWDTTFGDKIKNLEELMRFLNPSQQAVFILYSYGGLKGGKLADKLGVSKSRISSIFKDAKQRINRIKKARAIFKELLETDGVGDLNEAILGHFAPVINEEIKRQKRNVFYKYAVREKGTKGFPLIELSKEDIAELLKLTTIGRMIELDILLNKYVELVHNLRAIGIYEGFNLYLDTMSVFIMYGKEKIKTQEKIRMLDVAKTHGVNQDSVKNTMRKLLDRAGYGNMASPFLVDYMNGNGLELEDVKETDIPDLLERFPVKTINKEELDKMFRVYIAHVRLMKKIGINKGRTVPENLISAFLNLAGKNTEITVAKIGRKALSRNMQLISYLGAMVKRLETHNGRMDIFAASSSEDIVFRKAFLVELSAVSDKQRIQDVLRSSI